jgi:predicted permease
MRALSRLCRRLGNYARLRRGHEARLREEMETHIASLTEENIAAGMPPEEAHRQARLKFGAVEAIREDYQAEARLPFLDTLLLDVRYALRVLRKSPTFTVVAFVTLMLGIGANVVVFGVLNTVLLRPLAVSDPSSLYQVRPKPWMSFRLLTTSYPAFEDYRRRTSAFSEMAAVNGYARAELSWHGNVLREISGEEVTGNYFDLLGVGAAEGRIFHEAEEHGAASAPLLVLSDALWRAAFHADPSVVGATVELDQHPFTVVGVAPAAFHGMEKFRWTEYWIPMANEEQVEGSDYLHDRRSRFTVIGRLKPEVTAQQATDNLDAIALQLAKEYPATDDGQLLRLIHPGLFGDEGEVIRGFLWSVTALALLVLAAACANLATLFAARAADRSQELALRVALGSSRRRLVRQLLTEAVMVSLLGGAGALVGAYALLGLLSRWQSPYGRLPVEVDARVYGAGVAFTLVSALLFGLLPARQVWQSSPLQSLKSGPAEGARRWALRDWLLGAQIAICTLLVTASLVAVRSMQRVLQVPLGFQPQGAMLVHLDLDAVGPAGETADAKRKKMIDAVRSIPGVTAVGRVSRTPLNGGMYGVPIFAPGTTEFTLPNSVLAPYVFSMTPGYLEAAGTRLLDGRDVSWHDTARTPYVAVVNETFARKMWGATHPPGQGDSPAQPGLGQRFVLDGQLREVVGVAEDGKYHDLREPQQPVVYVPYAQREMGDGVFVVRSQRSPSEMAAVLARTLGGAVPEKQIAPQRWMDTLDTEVFPARAATVALGVMGLLAAMLAVTGIFGMAAYSVSRRRRELGIRMALGARRLQVMRAAVGRPMVLLGLGSGVGLFAGVLAGRVMGLIVYQANPQDPVVVGGAVVTMMVLGVVASAVPARRALGVDPSRLMREE